MRHDPAGASIIIMLRSLKLHGMAHAVDDLVTQGVLAFEAATPRLRASHLTRTSRVLILCQATSLRPLSASSIVVSS